jgi:maleate cis-trans isomerase
MAGMNLSERDMALGRRFGQISPLEIYAHAIEVNHNDAEAILISCADFGSAQLIENSKIN